jgi:PKD repeat protein
MRVLGVCWLMLVAVLVLVGCPQGTSLVPQASITARITISSDSGPAPLTVYVSAVESGSSSGPIVGVQWDFAGQAQADTIDAAHTFSDPGRYPVTLTVADSAGQQAVTVVNVRVQGGPATAVIQTDANSGSAPLSIRFDGTASTASDDQILDYFWDFGDGETSRSATPRHVFQYTGSYAVQLRVVTCGGVEASASVVITVTGTQSGSLQFNGSQYATLPVDVEEPLSAFTFTAWFDAEQDGGRLVSIGTSAVTLDILPDTGIIRVQQGGQSFEGSAPGLGGWHRVTFAFDSASGATVEVDGLEATSAALTGEVSVTDLILGNGFRGKISAVSFSGIVASDEQAGGDASGGSSSALLGEWPLDEGSGQTLGNSVTGGLPGTLGGSTDVEASDPAWSSDSP